MCLLSLERQQPATPMLAFSSCPTTEQLLGQKSCRTKVSRIFRIFVPNFAPNFAPNFPRIFRKTFRASFRGRRRPEKIHQKSPPCFNAKVPGKHEKNIHKILLESRQSNNWDTISCDAPYSAIGFRCKPFLRYPPC